MKQEPNENIEMVEGYLECALWSSLDDNQQPLDANFDLESFTTDAMACAIADCNAFKKLAGDRLNNVEESSIGHDFWLTRNGHGAGFWSRDLGKIGDDLTDICKQFKELNCYVNDNGMIDLE